jgi:hypothetical protein
MSTHDLPAFDGFPYVLTRLVAAFYHIILLPKGILFEHLLDLTRRQADANRLHTCLVLDKDRCVYFLPDGTEQLSTQIPRGGFVTSGELRYCQTWPASEDLLERARRLETFNRLPIDGCLLGDLTKGGRTATEDELVRLAGLQKIGVPKGLVQCPFCCEWKGRCVDPNPRLKNLLVPVHCLCENDNFCAWCREYLYDRKLNGNYYDRVRGDIIHVPGFSVLAHRCGGIDTGAPLEDTCDIRRERREALIRRMRGDKATQEMNKFNQTLH